MPTNSTTILTALPAIRPRPGEGLQHDDSAGIFRFHSMGNGAGFRQVDFDQIFLGIPSRFVNSQSSIGASAKSQYRPSPCDYLSLKRR